MNLAARYCDRLVLLNEGKVVAAGTPEDLLTSQVLEPVYGVSVRRVEDPDCVQLVFRRAPDHRAAASPEQVAVSIGDKSEEG